MTCLMCVCATVRVVLYADNVTDQAKGIDQQQGQPGQAPIPTQTTRVALTSVAHQDATYHESAKEHTWTIARQRGGRQLTEEEDTSE